MKLPLSETLTVYWGGEEVPGFTIYALGPPSLADAPELAESLEDLPAAENTFLLGGEGWLVRTWDIRMEWWPATEVFNAAIERVFSELIRCGFRVVWVGVEGHFVDPPDLFDVEFVPDGILAASSATTGFVTTLDLGEPVVSLPATVIADLRKAGEGLANASS